MCNHNWIGVREGDCPECLWTDANHCRQLDKRSVAVAERAVQIAAASLPNRQDRARVLKIAEIENNYKAIKVAKVLNRA